MRRQTSSMCSFTPNASWITITPPLRAPLGAWTESGVSAGMLRTVPRPREARFRRSSGRELPARRCADEVGAVESEHDLGHETQQIVLGIEVDRVINVVLA